MTAPDRIWVDDDTWFSKPVTYPDATEYLRADVVEARLSDPIAVHANMLRGAIAKPTVEQIIHLYGRKAFQPMIDAAVAKALEDACVAVSEHADWPEDEHGRTEQGGLFARVINAILAITPAVTPAPDAAKAAAQADYEARILATLEPASGGVTSDDPDYPLIDRICVATDCRPSEAKAAIASLRAPLAAPVAIDRVDALVKAAEAMVKRGVVNQDECGGCVECGSTGVNGGDYGYAGEADEDHEPDCPYIMLRAALAAYRGDAK